MDDSPSRQYFFVISSARSGSTWLVDLLNNHPEFACSYVEPLNEEQKLTGSTEEKLDHIAKVVHESKLSVVGCKLFVGQLQVHSIRISDLVKRFSSCRFFVLQRENILEQYVSFMIAIQNNVWYSMHSVNNDTIELDEKDFRKYVQNIRSYWNEVLSDDVVKERAFFSTYEKLCKDSRYVVNEFFTFMDAYIPDKEYKSYGVRQNPLPITKKIRNYDQVKDIVVEILKQYRKDYFCN